jgi:alpha-galactosidase
MHPRSFLAIFFLLFVRSAVADPALPVSGGAEFNGCRAAWNETELVMGNRHIERKWRISHGQLTATSFRNLETGTEWIREPSKQPAPFFEGWPASAKLRISAGRARLEVTGEEALQVLVADAGGGRTLCRFRIFPGAAGVEIFTEPALDGARPDSPEAEKKPGAGPTGVEMAKESPPAADSQESRENLLLAPRHLRLTQAVIMDQSDVRNELVQENEWLLLNERALELTGNVFALEDILTGEGLVFVKFAPLPHARPVKSAWDCQIQAGQRRARFSGSGYPGVLLAYSGGVSGRTIVLQDFQRQLRRYVPERDGMFQSNTWGDRSADSRVSEAFLLQEIEAGARLGVDVVQIDDGWQKGMTGNSAFGKGAWGKFYAADPDFWTPHPQRFPNGLPPLVAAAAERQMKLGLWFAPDSEDSNAHWERDADLILGMYQKLGIRYVKIDAVEIADRKAEENLRRFYDKVLGQTKGEVAFDIDATAGLRPGFFGTPHAGPIYVENRYTDWQNYWPHLTLRNLWELSRYVDPLRLRMEFLNNSRNTAKYGDDPLAPSTYPPDYLFASVMAANPLGFFEVSHLPKEFVVSVSKLVAVWKQERERWYSGKMIPIGDVPDGRSWTGFASVGAGAREGYILVFREWNEQAQTSIPLPMFAPGAHRLTPLAGTGTAALKDGKLTVTIPEARRYLWLKVSPAE